MPSVTPADVDLWLARYIRAELSSLAPTASVSTTEPVALDVAAPPLVVVRADFGRKRSPISFDASVGYSVLAGTRMNEAPANELVRVVYGIVTDEAMIFAPGSPFVSIDAERIVGPYAVTERLDKARRYFTVPYVTVGIW